MVIFADNYQESKAGFDAVSLMKQMEIPYAYYVYAVSHNGIADYMHFGYYTEKDQQIHEAQENLANKMKGLIPEGVTHILDSGCGLGRTTWDLTRAGYDVTGISPHSQSLEMARAKYFEIKDHFITSSYEDFSPQKKYDMIFFQESSQYIDTQKIFKKASRLLRDQGFVLVCDEVRYSKNPLLLYNNRDQMIEFARIYGFDIMHNQVITKEVLPTRYYLPKTLRQRVDDIAGIFESSRPSVRQEVFDLAERWEKATRGFELGQFGYEIFLFKKVTPNRSPNILEKSLLSGHRLVSYGARGIKKIKHLTKR